MAAAAAAARWTACSLALTAIFSSTLIVAVCKDQGPTGRPLRGGGRELCSRGGRSRAAGCLCRATDVLRNAGALKRERLQAPTRPALTWRITAQKCPPTTLGGRPRG